MKAIIGLLTIFILSGCATTQNKFKEKPIVWKDNDKQPFTPKPSENWVPKFGDVLDKTFLRPFSHFWRFQTDKEAQNINALGEVPDSSWYTNRMALEQLDPERVARGPCPRNPNKLKDGLVATSGKVGGANPGFFVKDPSTGQRYLLKFGGSSQPGRASAADVIGSKIYWAAGFETPCNRTFYMDPKKLSIEEGAMKENREGKKTPLRRADIRSAVEGTPRNTRGEIRTLASRFLPGEPLGPFRYAGTRQGDPNDVIPHQHRRELRGSKIIASWINHFDQRPQNSYTSFVRSEDSKGGYVQHFLIDFGACFGSVWKQEAMSRRSGHSYYFDKQHVLEDFLTLGLITRPWDKAKTYEDGPIFGYYDVANFRPGKWRVGYQNVAFNHMQPEDAFWGAKIVSRFSDEHIRKLVKRAKFRDRTNKRYLERVLIGRRDKLVKYWFDRMSSFADPTTEDRQACFSDLMVRYGYEEASDSYYEFRKKGTDRWKDPDYVSDRRVCYSFEDSPNGTYIVLEGQIRRTYQRYPAEKIEAHYIVMDNSIRLVGLER
jgi:hypothetical protein